MLGGEEMKIKEYRTIKGYTQREIAELLGIKQNTYRDKINKRIIKCNL